VHFFDVSGEAAAKAARGAWFTLCSHGQNDTEMLQARFESYLMNSRFSGLLRLLGLQENI
jgi:hypothetical protein